MGLRLFRLAARPRRAMAPASGSGSRGREERAKTLSFQLGQVENGLEGGIALLGDGLTEGLRLPAINGRPTFNAGTGGARAQDAAHVAALVLGEPRPAAVFAHVGVNDCMYGQETPVGEWLAAYARIGEAAAGYAPWKERIEALFREAS